MRQQPPNEGMKLTKNYLDWSFAAYARCSRDLETALWISGVVHSVGLPPHRLEARS
jgi:hypothetical protein